MMMATVPDGSSSPANISAFRLDIENVAPFSSKKGKQVNIISLLPPNLQSCFSKSSEQQLLHQNIYSLKIYDAQGVSNCQFILVVKDRKNSRERKVHCNLALATCYLKSNSINRIYFKCSAASINSFREYIDKETFDGTTELTINCIMVADVVREHIEGVKSIAFLYLSTEEHLEKLTITDNKMTTIPPYSCLRRADAGRQSKKLDCSCKNLNWDVQEAMVYMRDLSFTNKAKLTLPVRLRPDMLALARFMARWSSSMCSNGINVTHGNTDFQVRFFSDTKFFILLLGVIIGILIPTMFLIIVKVLFG